MEIRVNECQTPINDELLKEYPREVTEWFLDAVNNVELIKNMISPDRKRARDLERDDEGKIIVDITQPHILEDMDYFRQPVLHYKKYGCYTFLRPNSNRNSEYWRFWEEEIRRCRDGYVRESDGEWVTGFMYFYLNYCPMMVNEKVKGSNMANRVEGFPRMWEGCYLRFHYLDQARKQGHHCIELARRGASKSYVLAAIMAHNLVLGENSVSKKRCISVLTAYEKEYLSDKDGTLSKFEPMIDFIFTHTPFPRKMLRRSTNDMVWEMGYDVDGVKKGSRNKVIGVSAKDNSDKLRGKRGWILYEEMGAFKGLLDLYDVTRKSVEDGDLVFACQYLVGTANNDESDFSSAKTLLYGTTGYNILATKNVYDKPKQGKDKFGFFFGCYMNRADCYDDNGNSDVVKALLQVLMARYKSKYSADPSSLLRVIAEDPITPAEAIIKVKTAYFPVTALTERLSQIELDDDFYNGTYVGGLVFENGKVEFRITGDEPIRSYKSYNNPNGAVEIYEMPQKDRNNNVIRDRYLLSCDPFDNDQAESSSLFSVLVLDLWTDRIVAEFTGRRAFADDNYEICRMMCMFFNGKCLYESNKKGLYQYFRKMNSTHYLAETPEFLRDKSLVKYQAFGSNMYGVNANSAINNYANSLIKDWLLGATEITGVNADGEEYTEKIPRLYSLKNKALIEELIAFTPEINVDRIRSMGMLMLYREQMMVTYQGNLRREEEDDDEDEFFKINYDYKFQ